MASPRGASCELIGRGGLPGQVALVSSVPLGQSMAAQAASQAGWFGGTWWHGPKMGRRGVEDVHGERRALYQPSALSGVRMAERVM